MRLMVLGGGSCQMSLIKRAGEAGHLVAVADYLTDCPGRALADAYEPVSTFDIDGVLDFARRQRIEGIVTAGTDQPVYTAAVVARALGLHFYADPATALAVTNKRVMKALFCRHGIPCTAWQLIGRDFADAQIKGLRFPAVLKPVDSQGQRGIFLVENAGEVRQRIGETLAFSREDKALLEEYYKSDEITVNGWAENGRVTLLSVVDRVTIRRTRHIGVCLCHHFPSVHLARHYDAIDALTRRIVTALGIQNGPLYFQYLLGGEGLVVNEIAMRIGGAYEDLTIPIISGIDILGMVLDFVQHGRCDTRPLSAYDLRKNEKFLSTQLFFCRPGRLSHITPPEQMLRLPGMRCIGYNFAPGDVIPGIENATARAGYMIIGGNRFADMIGNVNNAFAHLHALNAQGNNLVIAYRDYRDKYLFYDGPWDTEGS